MLTVTLVVSSREKWTALGLGRANAINLSPAMLLKVLDVIPAKAGNQSFQSVT